MNDTTFATGLLKTFKPVGWERSVIEQFIGALKRVSNFKDYFIIKRCFLVKIISELRKK